MTIHIRESVIVTAVQLCTSNVHSNYSTINIYLVLCKTIITLDRFIIMHVMYYMSIKISNALQLYGNIVIIHTKKIQAKYHNQQKKPFSFFHSLR